MGVKINFDTYVGAAAETTYGTAAALTMGMDVRSVNIEEAVTVAPEAGMRQSGGALMPGRVYKAGMRTVTATIVAAIPIKGAGLWLQAGTGATVANTADVDADGSAAPGRNRHVYTIGTTLPSMTLEVKLGTDMTGSDTAVTITGAVCQSFKIAGVMEDRVIGTWVFIGQTMSDPASPSSTPTFPAGAFMRHIDAVNAYLTLNSVNVEFERFELDIQHGTGRRPKYGSDQTNRPYAAIEGLRSVTMTITRERADNTYRAAYLAETLLNNASLYYAIGDDKFRLFVHNVYITEYTPPELSSPDGRMMETFTLTATNDGSDLGVQIVTEDDITDGVSPS